MPAVSGLSLGAPGVYHAPPNPPHALTAVRMDVAGFAGVAPRGPAWVPVVDARHPSGAAMVAAGRPRARSQAVRVESWEEYRHAFGGFEGPGRLPWAVAAFFAQGGRRAWVVRVVASSEPGAGMAGASLKGLDAPVDEPGLRARSEGRWGNALRVSLRCRTQPLELEPLAPGQLLLPAGTHLPAGSLLRVTAPDGLPALRWVDGVERRPRTDARGHDEVAILDAPVPADPHEPPRFEVVTAEVSIDDGDGRFERFADLGLRHGHPRWVADVLCDESTLVWPDAEWATGELRPDPDLRIARTGQWVGGRDRYRDLVAGDTVGDPAAVDDEPPLWEGAAALLATDEVSTICVPDLYEPAGLATIAPRPPAAPAAGAEFSRCLEPDDEAEPLAPALAPLEGLERDPANAAELAEIVRLQLDVVALAERCGATALLDVPPGLSRNALLRWRANFDSAYAAAYHPWLRAHGLGPAGASPRRVPPSAVAAGVIAATELRYGLAQGPANALAARIVDAERRLDRRELDELHLAGINVYGVDRDGVRLGAARTLAADPRWRQLTVRRLATMIGRALRAQMAWAAFEPAGPALRAELKHALEAFMRDLHRAGALAGALADDGFFVRCDDSLNPPAAVDAGRLVVEVGFAPVDPLEYVVVRLVRTDDGGVQLEDAGA